MKIYFLLMLVFIGTGAINAQTLGTFTDSRDGQEYNTVTYEVLLKDDTKTTTTWMAQNLNYKAESSYCYDDYDTNCDIMGRLYSWSAAMNACPKGWRLPKDEDWYALANLYGGVEKAGKHLKSSDDLWRDRKGTNKSKFNGMPFGNGDQKIKGAYYGFGSLVIYWSATEKDENYAWDWKLFGEELFRYEGEKERMLNCVRCVKD